ncbi:kinesin [Sphingomonas sp. R1]|uniref:kinesin n=1 Tax=Sphingomonas sp. R1 TaxID=399176 RepID=UPI0022257BCF|nr:kinesin [Sphingomonas sp. R1]UYY77500.1 kinesin [Sphingomonas sp. R1]
MSHTNENQITDEGGIEELRSELEKVKAKNKELLAEKQKVKQKAQEAQDAADEAAQQAAERGGDLEALKAAHAKELQKLQAKLDAADTDLRTIRVDNEIARALAEGNVRPEMTEAVTALLKTKVQYEGGVATIEGRPIGEFAGEYLGGETGAHFRRASDNSGGGATGNTSTKTNPVAGKEFSLGDYQTLKQTDPAAAAVWATETGNGYLNNI